MLEYNEKRDIWLLENDYTQLHKTDEGKALFELLEWDDEDNLIRKQGVPPLVLKVKFGTYWDARNATEIMHIDGVPTPFREIVK